MRKTAIVVLALLAVARSANAGDGIKTIGVQGGFAGVTGGDSSFPGFGGAIGGDYGVGDTWSIVGNATWTSNQITPRGGRSHVVSEAVGARFALDVIQIVPYVCALGGLYEIGGGGLPKSELKVGVQAGAGVDYLVSRNFILGVELRGHFLPSDIASSGSNATPFYVTTFVKAEYAWGWF